MDAGSVFFLFRRRNLEERRAGEESLFRILGLRFGVFWAQVGFTPEVVRLPARGLEWGSSFWVLGWASGLV